MTGEEGMREKERVRQLKQQLRDELRQELDGYRQVEDEELYERIDRKIFEAGSQGYLPLKERLELRKSIFNSFRKLDILQQLRTYAGESQKEMIDQILFAFHALEILQMPQEPADPLG